MHAAHVVERDGTGDRLDAADAGGDAALARDLEEADITGARHVRAAAQLARAADVEHAHLVAVFLAEEHHRAELLRLRDRHHARARRLVAQHLGVDEAFDAADLLRRHRRAVAEVEARLVLVDERALLLHVRPQHLAQRLVHEVRRRVMAHGAVALVEVDLRRDRIADRELPRLHRAVMAEHVGLDLLRIAHLEEGEARAAFRELAAIADLAARFGVERRAVEDDDAFFADAEALHRRSVLVERDDAAFLGARLVAAESRLDAAILELRAALELARRARALLLRGHRRVEAFHVDREAALTPDVRGHVDREAVGVVELERHRAVEMSRVGPERVLEDRHAGLQRLGEALFLLAQRRGDTRFCLREIGIRLAHLRDEVRHEPVEERLLLAELVAVAHGAARDAAQHVAAPFVRGNDAVGDEEAAGADVVRDHAQRRRFEIFRSCPRGSPSMRLARRRPDQVLEEIDLVVRVLALEHRREPLDSHARVHRRLRERMHRSRLVAVELHEHEIPDLDVAVAVLVRRSGRPARDAGAVVVEDLRARAARAGVGHLPEVVLVAEAVDPRVRKSGNLTPDRARFVVGVMDGDPDTVAVESQALGGEVPREANGLGLEVVAEAEVAQHLEEREVAPRAADVVDVVVLALDADAALHGSGPGERWRPPPGTFAAER